MLFILSFIVLFLPSVFQIIVGNKSLKKTIKTRFIFICLISLFLQIILTIVSVVLSVFAITENGEKCATGAVGMIAISFFISIIMLLVIIIQFGLRIKYRKAT
jgi:uncharacterized membrane protein